MNHESPSASRLLIEKIVYPGRRLARHEGLVYFTDEGLPGETVEIEILKEHASFIEARTTAILIPSPRRIPERCDHYRVCGAYQTMSYADQLELKQIQLCEILSAAEISTPDDTKIVPSPSLWRYRNKIRFSLIRRGKETFLAYNEPGSQKSFIKAAGCFLATERSCALADAVLETAVERDLSNLAEVEVRESGPEGSPLLSLFWKTRRTIRDIDSFVSALLPRFSPSGIVSWTPEKGGRWAEALEWGRPSIREQAGGVIYEIGAGSFFQVNSAILPLVLEDIAASAGLQGMETMADVYGGVGTFGLALAKKTKRVYVVESAPENIRFLNANIAANDLRNVTVCEGTSEDWMADLAGRGLDLVIVDPPRKGLAPEVVRALIDHQTKKVLYLSCNPTTLARDLGVLSRNYSIESLRMYDFFPQTPHIETLAVLIPR